MQTNLQHYFTGFTLVDITVTGVVRGGDEYKRNQQRNWETVQQTIGLGAQPLEIVAPECLDVNLDYLEFGNMYQGKHKVWAWMFAVEHKDVFRKDNNPVERLEDYFSQVPIITGLDETARFMLPIFYCYGGIKNIYFKYGLRDLSNI
jgi:hypothetical protein